AGSSRSAQSCQAGIGIGIFQIRAIVNQQAAAVPDILLHLEDVLFTAAYHPHPDGRTSRSGFCRVDAENVFIFPAVEADFLGYRRIKDPLVNQSARRPVVQDLADLYQEPAFRQVADIEILPLVGSRNVYRLGKETIVLEGFLLQYRPSGPEGFQYRRPRKAVDGIGQT